MKISKNVKCSNVNSAANYDAAKRHIQCAIDALAEIVVSSSNISETEVVLTKSTIADLGVVLLSMPNK